MSCVPVVRCVCHQSLSDEVVEYELSVTSIRSTGASLISHGTLYRDKLEPELQDLVTRWRRISQQVKVSTPTAFVQIDNAVSGKELCQTSKVLVYYAMQCNELS